MQNLLTGTFIEKRFIRDLFGCNEEHGKHSKNGQELAIRVLQSAKKINSDVEMGLSEALAGQI